MEYRTQYLTRQTQGDAAAEAPSCPWPPTDQPCGDEMGVLPPCAPLATPYVPFQQNNPQTYTAKKGVIRGTLFPGLDLPFMGKVNNTELSNTPMHELQALSFALVELGLYLDTHPKDTQALELFHSYHELMDKGIAQYEATYGPLIQKNSSKNGSYDWLNNPWPWDYEANATKEG